MKKWIKSTMAILVALSLCVCAAGCGAGSKVATVNGEAISEEVFQYYLFSAAMVNIYQLDPTNTNPDFTNIDWNQTLENGNTLIEQIREDAITRVVNNVILMQKGEELGFEWGSERDDELNSQIDTMVAQYGEEMFELNNAGNGIASMDAYRNLSKQMSYTQAFLDDISLNPDKYITDMDTLKQNKSANGATVQHVLILNETEKTDDPQALAQEICDRAKAGEDFATLVQEYNEDPGATEAGYTFGPGEMVPEFEQASFALGIGEISDVVPSSYGYHVIKRLAGGYDLLELWRAESTIEINEKAIAKIDIQKIFDDALAAQAELQVLMQQQQAATGAVAE